MIAWKGDIDEILKSKMAKFKQVESICGKLNHVGNILPTGRYFLKSIRRLMQRYDPYGIQKVNQCEIDNFLQ